jgi:hypothetical protein
VGWGWDLSVQGSISLFKKIFTSSRNEFPNKLLANHHRNTTKLINFTYSNFGEFSQFH